VEKYSRAGQPTDDNMGIRIARWIPKATDKHSEYVILIAFILQQWFHENASMLRCTYVVCSITFSSSCIPSARHKHVPNSGLCTETSWCCFSSLDFFYFSV